MEPYGEDQRKTLKKKGRKGLEGKENLNRFGSKSETKKYK